MIVVLAVLVGVLFAVATYFFLKRSIVKMVFGIIMMSYATNLMLFLTGDLDQRELPILHLARDPIADPIPQALILTAIVIGFGILAFTLTLAYRFFFEIKSEDLDAMHEETEIA
jgi:multicomponent Na+:H+ antiporter subunit C